jgi:hypothetical protein
VLLSNNGYGDPRRSWAMTHSIPADRIHEGYGDRPFAKVPPLDWPADLFTLDAAIVDIMAEDCSFRYDSPAVWYGNHVPPMHV